MPLCSAAEPQHGLELAHLNEIVNEIISFISSTERQASV